jgi:hypothetical protein
MLSSIFSSSNIFSTFLSYLHIFNLVNFNLCIFDHFVFTPQSQGVENSSARIFSNPAGDYGSMVNERVGTSDWNDGAELGDTWQSRNSFSYGR